MTARRISSRRSVLLGAVIALMIAGALIAQRAGSNSVMVRANQSKPDVEHQQLVRVWVHGEEIYPNIVHVRPGKVLLRAENQVRSDITFVIERLSQDQSLQRVTSFVATHRARRADKEIRLGPGKYVFYEESMPEVKGTLIVSHD